ncbi:nucleotidyltransferase domain-containing protein [Iocasia frigidifontis]|uniref:Nucleotidyltransferase domain-containing protein n=1 Tax=Iocasia fonsfrigidae TaxID=2682810 RepID=A0A8A7K7N9_9FIRM|nr:nucleotidyltransferase domain-containing protein [Iocasia fonsfrigidae]
MAVANQKISIDIDNLIKKISQEIAAEEIILFGSHAYGIPNEDSDIDLCILSKLNGKRKLDLMRKARKAIIPLTSRPVDLLVYDQNDFYDRANIASTLEFKIKNEGVKVYGQ